MPVMHLRYTQLGRARRKCIVNFTRAIEHAIGMLRR